MSPFCLPSVHPQAPTLGTSISSETSDLTISPSWAVLVSCVFECVCMCVSVWVPCMGDTSSSAAVISPSFDRATFGWHNRCIFCLTPPHSLWNQQRPAERQVPIWWGAKPQLERGRMCFRVYPCPLVVTDSLTQFKTSIPGFILTKYENDSEGRYHFNGYTAYLQRHYWSQQPSDDFPQFESPHGPPAINTGTNRNYWIQGILYG